MQKVQNAMTSMEVQEDGFNHQQRCWQMGYLAKWAIGENRMMTDRPGFIKE